ncbi:MULTISPECIES: hypothetical protein [unclassified Rathayibacter]|jgi:hypothetical protein|uniref:hypothetical protein n=1 Tax=unclassified Rathayibacter TaxID=2609250 RepID=UPI0011B0C6B7|nr:MULTISPECIES: hypothetical protein [unclassified Rathayibacter]
MSLTRTPLEERVRDARHVSSLPLIVSGVGVVTAGLLPLAGSTLFTVGFLIPAFTSIALWIVLRATAAHAGVGMGRERMGPIAAVIAAISILTFLPTMFAGPAFLVEFVGPAFLVGVLLFAIGWRLENRSQWLAGLGVAVVSPFLFNSFLQDAAPESGLILGASYGSTPLSIDGVVLTIAGITLVVLGINTFRQETGRARGTRR